MENILSFRKYVSHGLYSYDLIFYNGIIKKHWDGLYDFNKWDRISEEVFSRNNYNITPATGENIVLLPAIVWALIKECQCLAANSNEREAAKISMKRSYDLCANWSYMIQSQFEYELPDIVGGEFEENKCLLWTVLEVGDLFDLQAAGVGDVMTGLNVYVVNRDKYDILRSCLNSPAVNIQKVLAIAEMFVATTYGFDIGYYNGITIKSSSCIDDAIKELESELTRRILAYESSVNSIKTVDEWLLEIDKLVTGSK